jgi:hypothetical protein
VQTDDGALIRELLVELAFAIRRHARAMLEAERAARLWLQGASTWGT